MAERSHDVVLLGASGFTGALTARELAARMPAGGRWAIAGRNRAKLEGVREQLAREHPGTPEPDLLHADVTDADSLRAIAEQANVVATTVGPYVRYGEPVVAACARAGAAYVDLTGEPEFVDRMWLEHHEQAQRTGARIVHACGFDSIPYDLGVWLCVHALPEDVPLRVRGYVRAGGRPSGGTLQSAVLAFSRARHTLAAGRARREREGRPGGGRRVRVQSDRPHRADGHWAVPMPTIDPQVVARSARALPRYGPDFVYGHYAAVKRLPVAVGGVAGVGALFALAQVPPARSLLLGRLQAGDGPTPEQRRAGWFSVRIVGQGGGRRVTCEVRGGDPGYGETSKMLAESALSLAHDDLPSTAGQVTTAVAMGGALLERLRGSGISFEVVADEAT